MTQDIPPEQRVKQLDAAMRQSTAHWTDRNFAILMVVQFVLAVLAAIWLSPLSWAGVESQTHLHVWAAVILGGLTTALPVYFAIAFPGRVMTRHTVAVGQMLMGALLIHLTGGRIETHFHVFGSLAFLAFYRDWKVLTTATLVVSVDHFWRGMFWPRSVFGIDAVQSYRWLEHVGWVLFEDLFLFAAIKQSLQQTRALARRQCELEVTMSLVENERDRFFDLSADMLCVANQEGFFVQVNPMWPKTLGFSREELLSRPLLEFVHPEDRATTVKAMEQLSEGCDIHDFENRYQRADGEYLWLSWSSHPSAENRLLYAVARDVTEKKKQAIALEEAIALAEEANSAKRDFLANMSHEIRTPMNAIIGMTDLVLATQLAPTQREYLAVVSEAAESLLAIINEILDFSKIEAGKLELESIPFELREEVGDALKPMGVRAHQKDLELTWHVAKEVPGWVRGDPVRLRQMIVNLVSNAVTYTDQGEVTVNVTTESVSDSELELHVAVRDTGRGIEESKRKTIFGAFHQADTSTTREFGGTGLGLAIVSRLAEMMGGKIWVESTEGEGSCFHFTAVFDRCDQGESRSDIPELDDLSELSVVVVDDNTTNRRILEETLNRWGLSVTAVESADEAMAALKQRPVNRSLPLVISDVHMPRTDGFMLAEQIRSEDELREAKIILLTSGPRQGDLRRCDELEVNAHLMKPIKPSELLDAVLLTVRNPHDRIAAHSTSEPELSPLPPQRLLLAEDGKANQLMAVELLKQWGHEVEVAEDGEQAVQLWQDGEFDSILMDVQMPVLDGFKATQRIRELEKGTGKHITIIALTAHAMKGDRERCLAAGMDDYVSKPIRKADLYRALSKVQAPTTGDRADTPKKNGQTPIVDWPTALSRMGGNPDLLKRMINVTLTEIPKLQRQLQASIRSEKAKESRRLAHTIKGEAAAVAALPTQKAAAAIEESLYENNLQRAFEQLEVLDTAVKEFVEHCSERVARDDEG